MNVKRYVTLRCFYITCRNVPYVRTLRYGTLQYINGSKRTDQRYVTVSYVMLRYVT